MSKLQRLRDNVAAIRHALTATSEYDQEVLWKFTGFGGLNFVLNPLDTGAWNKSDMECFCDTVMLQQLLRDNSSDDKVYNRWMQSLKASVMTAYYTPEVLVQAIAKEIDGHAMLKGLHRDGGFRRFIDPAAGMGVFGREMVINMDDAQYPVSGVEVTMYEKDMLTGLMLSRRYDGPAADVRIAGFETIPASELGTYDLVATNVPFGSIQVYDPAYSNSKEDVKREATKMIHRYFVLKGLDCLRDGGLLVYIITSNWLNRDVRQVQEALRQSRLIGAYRLANNLFKESGTEVGTDLIVLQKDARRGELTQDEVMITTTYEDCGCPANLYFTVKADHVIATSQTVGTDAYGKRGFEYRHEGGVEGIAKDVRAVLAKDLADNLAAQPQGTEQQTQQTHPQPLPAREGSGYTQGEKGGKTGKTGGSGKQAESKPAKKAEPKLTAREMTMVAIYECYQQLYGYEQREQKENADLRRDLNKLYDDFVKEFGLLNDRKNSRAVNGIKGYGNISELLSLEIKTDGGWTKADIMLRPVAFAQEAEEEKTLTATEALARSLNEFGRADMSYMLAATGMTQEAVMEELKGELFYNPLNGEYEIRARFISGDVISKADAIKQHCGYTGPDFDLSKYRDGDMSKVKNPTEREVLTSLLALEAATPTPIPFGELDFNLGERWIDTSVYERFASEFFSMPEDREYTWRGGRAEVTIRYESVIDEYAVGCNSYNEKIRTKYSVSSEASSTLYGMDLLTHALKNTCPKMQRYKRDSEGRKMRDENDKWLKEEDPDKTQLAQQKIDEIRQGFVEWLQRQPREERDRLADVYNRRFNCFVKPKYDGSHQTFPGVNWQGLQDKFGIPVPTADGKGGLYQSQKDCIWMLLLNGGGICDHEVGSGKTLIMCICAHEMKRLGLCHKPMIIGLKANVSVIAETYTTAYPDAKVLFAKAADYSGKNRVDFLNRMKNNDWDVIIMSHDQFNRIPQSDEIQEEQIDDELRQLDDALDLLDKVRNGEVTTKMRKGLEQRKRTMTARLERLQDQMAAAKDDVVDFEQMGIDHIFVDESHQFKNLGFSTRHDRVAGLGDNRGSQRATNMLMAIRTIQKRTGRDLGATFLSGTTVTNSLTELYSLFRYLRPRALARQQITCFDAWAAIFTKKTTEFEFSVTNSIVMKERFRYFIKVPELAMFYNEITDFRTAEDVGIERPKANHRLLNIEPTPDQQQYIQTLMQFARTGDFSLIGLYGLTEEQQRGKMLYATDHARKMSLDMRLIDTSYSDHPRNKCSVCASQVADYYRRYDAVKGTQMIFSDLSTWQGREKGFNVYDEIKRKLVDDYGIPPQEIRFIQECSSDRAKQRLIQQVNDGEVRVLFGSTTMLGTGVNAQRRVVAIHHLDTPWRPSDLEQRNGRGIRKGNEVARLYAGDQVDILVYAVERSLDSYKFNLLHCKQTFINQLKRGRLGVRTLDEGSMDEESGMNFAEYMAVLSGNTDLLERAKMEKKITMLEAQRKTFYSDQQVQQQRQEDLRQRVEATKEHLLKAREDLARFNRSRQLTDSGDVLNDIRLDGFTVPDGFPIGSDDYNKAVGEELFRLDRTTNTLGQYRTVGSIYGFPIVMRSETVYSEIGGGQQVVNTFLVEGGLLYKHQQGRLNRTSARLSATFPLQALERLPQLIHEWEEFVESNTQRIRQLDDILTQTWGRDLELRTLKAQLQELDRKIARELDKQEDSTQAVPLRVAA